MTRSDDSASSSSVKQILPIVSVLGIHFDITMYLSNEILDFLVCFPDTIHPSSIEEDPTANLCNKQGN